MTSNLAPSLTVSIVVYHLDEPVLRQNLDSLGIAATDARQCGLLGELTLFLIDNSPAGKHRTTLRDLAQRLESQDVQVQVLSGHGNVGYGRGHNLAIHSTPVSPAAESYYLILNPDVIMAADALTIGMRWLSTHQPTVSVAPAISDGNGGRASSCKRYPSVLDFLLRGFAPAFIKKRFAQRLARYDMADLAQDRPSEDIPVISGCFMLFKLPALKTLRGFDPAYFLYFEDFDLSLRAHRLGSLTYLPQMQITHLGGHSAKKGLRHIGMFVRSGWRFFSTHGWRWV